LGTLTADWKKVAGLPSLARVTGRASALSRVAQVVLVLERQQWEVLRTTGYALGQRHCGCSAIADALGRECSSGAGLDHLPDTCPMVERVDGSMAKSSP
jgi:hypothetical protein